MDKALAHLSERGTVMRQLIADYPAPSFEAHTNFYHELVDSIISQQLCVKAARAIEERFESLFDGMMPTPEQLREKRYRRAACSWS